MALVLLVQNFTRVVLHLSWTWFGLDLDGSCLGLGFGLGGCFVVLVSDGIVLLRSLLRDTKCLKKCILNCSVWCYSNSRVYTCIAIILLIWVRFVKYVLCGMLQPKAHEAKISVWLVSQNISTWSYKLELFWINHTVPLQYGWLDDLKEVNCCNDNSTYY